MLTGNLPPSIGNCNKLNYLAANFTQVSGNIPTTYSNLTSLALLDLRNTFINGSIPDWLGELPQLNHLYEYLFLFEIPRPLKTFVYCRVLASTNIAGPIPPSFGKLANADRIDLSYNPGLNGSLPSSLGEKLNPRYLQLSHTSISGVIPSSLGNMSRLTELYLDGMSLTGQIPETFANLKELISLSLQNNNLSGPIPSSLGNATNLVDLSLASNSLNATIPESFVNLQHLSFLGLGYNRLTETKMINVDVMCSFLDDNFLNGTIPSEYANIGTLKALSVQYNLITGDLRDISEMFANRSDIDGLEVAYNCMSTPITFDVPNPTKFSLTPQRHVCDKLSFGGSPDTNPTSTNVLDKFETQITPFFPNVIIMVAVTSGSILVLILGLAAQRPVEMEKKNKGFHDMNESGQTQKNVLQHIDIMDIEETAATPPGDTTPTEPSKISPHQSTTEEGEQEPVLMTVWLREVDPDVQRQQFLNNRHSVVIGTQQTQQTIATRTESESKSANQSLLIDSSPRERVGKNKRNTRMAHPSPQLSRYEQTVREVAPTSNTDLEIHLQRSYGLFHTWNHALVMEWARLKELDPIIVNIMKDYHIDGSLVASLDVHSLKEKCNVQEFRIRAKFIQAAEFLKDSRNVLSTSMSNDAISMLPRYEGRDDENETSEANTTDES
ncbi:hypothetical protein HDU76_000350 [Blyttiomyces sp. JEL0837]|nr:hypothetical protein HDU76_000350 [Blyttiomyces sp. JEL0837]